MVASLDGLFALLVYLPFGKINIAVVVVRDFVMIQQCETRSSAVADRPRDTSCY